MPIHLETSGVDPISGQPNWITLSPKRHAPPRLELLAGCNELKVVIHKQDDLHFAEVMAEKALNAKKDFLNSQDINTKIPKHISLFLQPGWSSTEGQELAIEYVKHHPAWRLSMQTHKWLDLL